MILEVRTRNGELIAKYLGQMAVINFDKLMSATNLFKMVTKKLKPTPESDKVEEYMCFVAITYCKLQITYDFELWFAPDDYIKVIR